MARPCIAAVAVAALVAKHVRAEIFNLGNTPAPGSGELKGHYFFYAYAGAKVEFVRVVAHVATTSASDKDLAYYDGLELNLLPWHLLSNAVNSTRFCAASTDVKAGLAKRVGGLSFKKHLTATAPYNDTDRFWQVVRFPREAHSNDAPTGFLDDPQPQVGSWTVHTTGTYILTLSNCGNFENATVSGRVVVKNEKGYLPGNEYLRMPFYAWLSLGYTCVGLAWLALSLRWWRSLVGLHSQLLIVVFLGLFEATLCWAALKGVNDSGLQNTLLAKSANSFGVVKVASGIYFMLLVANGWILERPALSQLDMLKINIACGLFIPIEFIRQSVMSFQYSLGYSPRPVVVCVAVAVALHGLLLIRIFCGLSRLRGSLSDRGEVDKMKLAQNMRLALGVTALVGAVFAALRAYDALKDENTVETWQRHWILSDGASQLSFGGVLCIVMYLLAPGSKSYMYAHLDDDRAIAGDQPKDEERENITHEGKGIGMGVSPFTIGAEDDDDEDMETISPSGRQP